jgi:hypothetical protein
MVEEFDNPNMPNSSETEGNRQKLGAVLNFRK